MKISRNAMYPLVIRSHCIPIHMWCICGPGSAQFLKHIFLVHDFVKCGIVYAELGLGSKVLGMRKKRAIRQKMIDDQVAYLEKLKGEEDNRCARAVSKLQIA